MKVAYDRETDSLTLTLGASRVRESDDVAPGLIADCGEDGRVVRLEILRASRIVDDVEELQIDHSSR